MSLFVHKSIMLSQMDFPSFEVNSPCMENDIWMVLFRTYIFDYLSTTVILHHFSPSVVNSPFPKEEPQQILPQMVLVYGRLVVDIFFILLPFISAKDNEFPTNVPYTHKWVAKRHQYSIFHTTVICIGNSFRMETVDLRTLPGKIKVGGVLASIVGIIALAIHKGPVLKTSRLHHKHVLHESKHWVLGTLLIIMCYVVMSLWIVLQGRFLKKYPSALLLTTLQSILSAFQTFFVALVFEKDFSRWKLGLDVGLVTVVYCGIVVSGISYYLQAWCINKRGPVFTAMFMPLGLIFTSIISPFMFGEPLILGSVIGGILLVLGLYCVLWSKRKEEAIRKLEAEEEKGNSEEKDMTIIVTNKDQNS